MKKLLVSLMSMVMVIAMVGGGAFAYFTDSETSTGNSFSAGTLDLGLSNTSGTEANGSTADTWVMSNMAPGNTKDGTLYVKNHGSIDAGSVLVGFDYVVTNVSTPATVHPQGVDVLDAQIRVTTLKWNGSSVSALEGKTLAELKAMGNYDLGGLSAGAEGALYILWTLDTDSDNGVQGDSVAVTLNMGLTQQ